MIIKRFAVDIDGVIADIGQGLEKLLSKRLNREVKSEEITQYDLSYMGVKSKELKQIFNKDFYKNLPVIEGARETLSCLYPDNYISLVTSRNQYPEVMRDTFNWLIDNGILFDNLVQSTNKAEAMRNENLDFLIDDYFVTCRNLAKEGIDSFLFEQPWNREIKRKTAMEYKHIKRVKNWKDVTKYIG